MNPHQRVPKNLWYLWNPFICGKIRSISQIITLSLICGTPLPAQDQPTSKKPNILFIITDDQGYGDMACHGHPFIKTPHLDKLHSQSSRFTDYHASPTCSPTRSALMSGRDPFEVGISHTILERERMALSATTIAQVLKNSGYTTGVFGKWHLGDADPYQPNNRGFDEVFIHGAGGIGQRYDGSQGDAPGNRYFDPAIRHNGTFVKTSGYCTDIFFRQALGWIHQQKDKPFFAYIALNAPHSPYVVAEKYSNIYQDKAHNKEQAAFLGMITNIDENIGLTMEKLEAWGIANNTILIFTTDNGTAAGASVFNAGMKGSKGTVHEGGTHVPLFMRLPGLTPAGKNYDQLTRHIDLFPTLADLAGADVSHMKLAGRSLVPLLRAPSTAWPDRKLFFHTGRWPKAGANERFGKGDPNPDHHKHKSYAIRTEEWRLIGPDALYNIKTDPSETTNVFAKHLDVVNDLQKSYDTFWDKARPLLINEDAPLDVEKAFEAAYRRQKQTKGIPKWIAPKI